MFEVGEDEGGFRYSSDLAGAGGDVLEGSPVAAEQGEAAFAGAAQGSQQRVVGAGVGGAVSLVTSGPGGVIAASPVWGSALLVAYGPVQGRSLVEWAPLVGHWWWRKALGQHRYRARPMKPRPAGTLAPSGGYGPVAGAGR